MKYLVLLAIVLVVIWFLRNNRRSGPKSDTSKSDAARPGQPGEPQDMVRCPVCSVHLPRTDALPGVHGRFYCCADHRSRDGD